ncbi:MAG TPA: hypothetical protein VNT54_12145 [Solirubrobacteraceae bacterium]|nr:hypothetical protein [Solirubrobacteraceae bacterium]
MRATSGVTCALAAATACLALAACGGDDDAARGDTATAPTATAAAAAGTASGLGAARFRALDDVYAAQLQIDGPGEDADAARLRAAAEPLLAACEALDEEDPLLAAFRPMCPVLTRFTEQLARLGSCGSAGPRACGRLVANVRRTLSEFRRLSRRSDAAIERSDLTAACKRALATPEPSYEVIASFERAFALLGRGAADEAGPALAAARDKAGRLPTARAALERFRGGCG